MRLFTASLVVLVLLACMMTSTGAVGQTAWQQLRDILDGDTVYLPGDAGYADAALQWNRLYVEAPLGIAYPTSEAHVAKVVKWAAHHKVPLWVRATGHGTPRSADKSLVVDVSKLTALSVDTTAQTATIAAGVQWGDVLAASVPLGLAAPVGTVLSISAAGFVVGGGIGWLARSAGYASDSLISAKIVLGDGSIHTASAHAQDPKDRDLLFALRGGSGAYGIITEVTIRLHPVADKVFAGAVFYPIKMARKVVQAYGKWHTTVPESITSMISFQNFPGGSRVVGVLAVCLDAALGEQLLQPMRSLPNVASDDFQEMSFKDVGNVLGGVSDPFPYYERGSNTKVWDREFEQTLLEMFATDDPKIDFSLVEVRQLGGAIPRAGALNDPNAAAAGQRDAAFSLQLISLATVGDQKQLAQLRKTGKEFVKIMEPYKTTGPLLTQLGSDAKDKDYQEAFTPAALAKMRNVKEWADPTGLFRHVVRGLFKEDAGSY